MEAIHIIQLMPTMILTVVAYLLKKEHARLSDKDKKLEVKIDDVNRELNNYKLEAQREFATKDELTRSISNLDKSISDLGNKIDSKFKDVTEHLIKINAQSARKEK